MLLDLRGGRLSAAPDVEAVCSKLSHVSRERAFVVGVFLPVEGLPLKHAVSRDQLLMTFDQPAKRVGSLDLAAGFVHTVISVTCGRVGFLSPRGHFYETLTSAVAFRAR